MVESGLSQLDLNPWESNGNLSNVVPACEGSRNPVIGECHRAGNVVTSDHVGSRCREWPSESADYALTSRRVAKS